MKIMNIFDPVSAVKTDGEISFNVWNRTYKFGKASCFPSSIISGGRELLKAPIKVNAVVNDQECDFCDADTRLTLKESDEYRTAVSAIETDNFVVNAVHNVEFDGCDIINLTIAPRGIKPGIEVFSGTNESPKVFHLNRLYLDVPLSKEHIRYYHGFPFGSYNGGYITGKKVPLRNDGMGSAGIIPEGGMDMGFKEQVYLGGDDVGIGFFFESDEEWNYEDCNKAFEILDTPDAFVLRIHFFDCEPRKWRDKGPNNELARDLFPISIKFGMQVTPIKPLESDMMYEKNLHIDCAKRFPQDHDEFLKNPIVEGTDEIGFDRLKRLGVETLYIHEKWNDLQNSYILTEETAARLRFIIDECHKRGIKVVPYFGFEISSLSPIYEKCKDKYLRQPAKDIIYKQRALWYRTPYQREIPTCMRSNWRNDFYEGIEKLIKEFNFDGFYFDSTFVPHACANHEHGCGYVDSNGVIRDTFPVFETRELAKRIYRLVTERGGVVNFHPTSCHNLAVLGFCSSLWDGEVFQGRLLRGELEVMPEALLRAQFDGHNIGVPVQALCYMNPPKWTFREAIGMMLLHWSIPKTVDWEDGLELMSNIWEIFDNFKTPDVKWRPYYRAKCPVTSLTDGVKVSCYEREDKILAIVATTRKSFSGKAKIETKYKNIQNAFSGEKISDNGVAEIEFSGFDFEMLVIEK